MAYTSGVHTVAIGGIGLAGSAKTTRLGVGFDIFSLGPRNAIQVAGCKDFGAVDLGCMPFDDTKVDNVGFVCVGLGEGPGVGAAGVGGHVAVGGVAVGGTGSSTGTISFFFNYER